MSFNNVGLVWSPETLENYLATITPPIWARAVCLHHTAAPSLAQRPRGLTVQHIKNIRDFYKEKGWHSGPHFFIDENEVFGMTPVLETGVHAVSFNKNSIGIEVLGDYDSEDPKSGRGLECWRTAATATKVLLNWLNIKANKNTVLFHRDDPKTSKTCPGTKVTKDWVLGLVVGASVENHNKSKPDDSLPVKQTVVVSEYLKDVKGYNDAEIKSLLHKDPDGMFFFGDAWLEHAYYDSKVEATIAPIDELVSIPNKRKTAITSFK